MDNKEAVKRLLLLLGRYKKTIVVIVGCLLVSTGLNLCVPLISRRIMDDGFIGGNKKLLIELVLVSMVIYTINSLIDIVKEKKRVDISAKIQYFLSEQSFSHLMKLRVNYFNNTNYAETLNNINTVEPWTPAWLSYCRSKFRSFNASSGTFLGYDGKRHFCVPR